MDKYIDSIKKQIQLRFPRNKIFVINETSMNINIQWNIIYITLPIKKLLVDELQSCYRMDLEIEIVEILYEEILKKKLEK